MMLSRKSENIFLLKKKSCYSAEQHWDWEKSWHQTSWTKIKCSATNKTQGTTETWKGSIQEVETGTGDPGGIQRHCPSMHGWVQESQSPPGFKSGDGREGQQEGLLQEDRDQRKTRENAGLLLNGTGNLVQKDMEKAEVVNAFLSLYW